MERFLLCRALQPTGYCRHVRASVRYPCGRSNLKTNEATTVKLMHMTHLKKTLDQCDIQQS